MAIKCPGCGNFISPETTSCPICGDAKELEAPVLEEGPSPSQGLIYDMWDHFWHVGSEGSAMSRNEVLILKILVGVLIVMMAVTLFSTH
ncbi:MAG: hypothetical protein OEZ51_13140 [Nitrospinota bacterium]|nr:hypothetical protein [Nitrospinota bacterium]